MKISNIASYANEKIKNGEMIPAEFRKSARIKAQRGVVGEEIVTIMKNGKVETRNTVKADATTGNPDWTVTNPSGERYVVDDLTFKDKYEVDPENPAQYRPKGAPVICVAVSEAVTFVAPWGSEMNIDAGGVLVLNKRNDIYGIQPEEFAETYKRTGLSEAEALAKALEILEDEEGEK